VNLQPDDVRQLLRQSLAGIAPEVSLDGVPEDADLAEELELDSMDVLNLVTAVYERTGVEVPERDYPRVATVEGWIGYLGTAG
jgi:acyl carrier protein